MYKTVMSGPKKGRLDLNSPLFASERVSFW